MTEAIYRKVQRGKRVHYELVDSPPQPVPAPVQEQPPTPASKPVLLQCLGCERVGTQEQLSASTDCDCWLHTQPAPVQEPEKLNPLTQLQVAYVMGLRDAQPRKAVKLTHHQITECHPVLYGLDDDTLAFARAIEAAVLKANGWTE